MMMIINRWWSNLNLYIRKNCQKHVLRCLEILFVEYNGESIKKVATTHTQTQIIIFVFFFGYFEELLPTHWAHEHIIIMIILILWPYSYSGYIYIWYVHSNHSQTHIHIHKIKANDANENLISNSYWLYQQQQQRIDE